MHRPKFSLEKFDKICLQYQDKNINKSFNKKYQIKNLIKKYKNNKIYKSFFKKLKYVSLDEYKTRQKEIIDNLCKKLRKRDYTEYVFIINKNNFFNSILIYNMIKDKIKISYIDIDFRDIYLYSENFYKERLKTNSKYKCAYIYCNDITYSNLHFLKIPYIGSIYTTSCYDSVEGIKRLYDKIIKLLKYSYEKRDVNIYLPKKVEYIPTFFSLLDTDSIKKYKLKDRYMIYFGFKVPIFNLSDIDKFKDLKFNENKMTEIIQYLNTEKKIVNSLEKLVELYSEKDWDLESESDSIFHNPNCTIEIVQIFNTKRDKSCDWWTVSDHPNITIDIVKANPDIDWAWCALSGNINTTWDIVNNNPDLPWDWKCLSRNPNITMDIVKNNLHKNWSFRDLTRNKNITNEIIIEFPDKDWDWASMFLLRNLNIDDLIKRFPDKDYSWGYILETKKLTIKKLDNVKDNLDKNWNWNNLSGNPNLTWDIVESNFDKNWDWEALSFHRMITIDILNNNLDKNWNYEMLSYNKYISGLSSFIQNNLDKNWNWKGLSANININIDLVKNNLDKNWDWEWLSANTIITWDIVKDNPDLPWDWENLSMNPNMSWDIIRNNLDKNWKANGFFKRKNLHLNGYYYPESVIEKYGLSTFEVPLDLIKYSINKDINSIDWHYLSSCKELTWDIVKDNLDKKWNWTFLERREDLTIKIILELLNESKKFPNVKLGWLCNNPIITWDIIKSNPDLPWDYKTLSANNKITWDIIVNNPDKNWSYQNFSINPNITWEVVYNNPDKNWDWKELSRNKFLKDPIALENYNKKQITNKKIKNILRKHKNLYDDILFSIDLYDS
jgi:hypothetical protein